MYDSSKDVLEFQGAWQNAVRIFKQIRRIYEGESFSLMYLLKKNDVVLPSEISKKMETTSARTSAILNSLEKKGEISRDIDPENRNNVLVSLTNSGRQRALDIMFQSQNLIKRVLSNMGERDAKEFIRLIKVFTSSFSECSEDLKLE